MAGQKQSCRQFSQTGTCKYGAKCRYSHETGAVSKPERTGSSSNQVCRSFMNTGVCSFEKTPGNKCKYLHNVSNSTPRNSKTSRNTTPQQSKRRDWSILLSNAPSLGANRLATFIEDALRMLRSDDSGVRQDLINDLGSEIGLKWIKWILESNYVLRSSDYKLGFFRHCVPFLTLITHEELLSSLVLEKAVGTIYNVVYGSSGQRGAKFFKHAVGHIETAISQAEESPHAKTQVEEAICAVSAGLFHTINLNQEAIVQGDFKSLAMVLDTCLHGYNTKDSYFVMSARKNILKMKDRLHLGDLIPNRTTNHHMPSMNFPEFHRQVDLPGELSVKGPRHQNDHASIEEISILPTESEINSTRQDFLPIRHANHHEEGIHRLLDSQFRLLREDTSGQLRDAISALMSRWKMIMESGEKASKETLRRIDANVKIFNGTAVQSVRFDERNGMVVDVTFDQPRNVVDMNLQQRRNWWKNISRDLQFGSLVALVDGTRATFLIVADREVENGQTWTDDAHNAVLQNEVFNLASNQQKAMISLKLAKLNSPADQAHIISLLSSPIAVLVEFPGLLFQSFEPILKCLKQLHNSSNIPFTRWLAPLPDAQYESQDGVMVKIPPPLYMTKGPGVTLGLSCITEDGYPLTHSIRSPVTVEALQAHTSLDLGQCQSLVLALQQEFALIQGPPGTGKSHVGLQLARILLANENIRSSPIVCVCYTNHALDQFLEQIMKTGETNIIRLGSRSKSEALKDRTLYVLRKDEERTKQEKHNIWELKSQITDIGEESQDLFSDMSRPIGWTQIQEYLLENMPHQYHDLFGAASEGPVRDAEGFTLVQHAYSKSDLFKLWERGSRHPVTKTQLPNTNRGIQNIRNSRDIWKLSRLERNRLLVFWTEEIRTSRESRLERTLQEFSHLDNGLKRQYGETDRRCLEKASVIGVTTTGLASNSEVLRKLKSKILIVEEAAEVLEAHTITALLPSVEHVILIGDHLQLRAKVNRYELSMESEQGKKYRLDESLFERLTQENYGGYKLPFAQLDTQRRMHPSIASLVRDTLYPQLCDHADTENRPEVVGMRKRLQWLDHQNHEDSATDVDSSTSKSNEWEAELVVALLRHISRQGVYSKDDIAVLTPYLGQLRKLRKKLMDVCEIIAIGERDLEEIAVAGDEDDAQEQPVKAQKGKMLEGCRISTVDNFQGEEAKVVIISLVRSNPEQKVGFLRTSNRINVLLSRARDGMFIIGDAGTAWSVPMWSDVISILDWGNNIGKHLQLQCPRHPDIQIAASCPDDFNQLAPEGGCSEQCFKRLACGHTCIMKCHSDMLHNVVQCYEDCTKQFKHCTHTCPKRCYQNCGKCQVEITSNITLPCGHTPQSLKCHETYDLAAIKCQEMVVRSLPRCSHTATMRCHVDLKTYVCHQPCGDLLPCSHLCRRRCSECRKPEIDNDSIIVVNHKNCEAPCGRLFTTCNHSCQKRCHGDEECGVCEAPCDVQCSHSRCPKNCSEPCVPCAETCTSTCPHRGQCNMPCAVPCDLLPCNERCELLLKCGHRCPSICGEPCPTPSSGCSICAISNVQEQVVDLVLMSTFAEATAVIDSDPLIFLACGHIYTVSTLDGHMGMNEIYILDPFGNPLEPRPLRKVTSRACPDCRSPLRNINRYNRAVKTALIDETTKRFMTHSAEELKLLTEYFAEAVLKIENAVTSFKEKKRGDGFVNEFETLAKLKNDALQNIFKIQKFIRSVQEAEQPYGRVRSMIINARRRGHADAMFDVPNSEIQHGFSLRGRCLKINFIFDFLWGYNTVLSSAAPDISKRELESFLFGKIKETIAECLQLSSDANDAKQLQLEIEARMYSAQFIALRLRHREPPRIPNANEPEDVRAAAEFRIAAYNDGLAELHAAASEELEQCLQMLTPETEKLRKGIEQAKQLLNGGIFYQSVSLSEMKEVYAAMARGFSGTGHWYYCENNHPFTIGECGMPMELARCTECGAQVGGQSHTAVEGIRRAEDLERQMTNMTI